MTLWIVLAIIIVAVIVDPYLDATVNQHEKRLDRKWWRWHALKPLRFQVPLGALMFLHLPRRWWVWVVVGCFFLWRLSLRYLAKKDWRL